MEGASDPSEGSAFSMSIRFDNKVAIVQMGSFLDGTGEKKQDAQGQTWVKVKGRDQDDKMVEGWVRGDLMKSYDPRLGNNDASGRARSSRTASARTSSRSSAKSCTSAATASRAAFSRMQVPLASTAAMTAFSVAPTDTRSGCVPTPLRGFVDSPTPSTPKARSPQHNSATRDRWRTRCRTARKPLGRRVSQPPWECRSPEGSRWTTSPNCARRFAGRPG